jgi:hypothetical protein
VELDSQQHVLDDLISVQDGSEFCGGDGTASDPYGICTAAHLDAVRNHLGAGTYFALRNDIDLSGATVAPIGSAATPFEGDFDGRYFAIRNLTSVGDCNQTNVGLFGEIGPNGQVRRVRLRDPDVSGSPRKGTLAGTNNGTISKVSVRLNQMVFAQCIGLPSPVGGVVGVNNGTITEATFFGRLEIYSYGMTGREIGGIVGENHGTIQRSHARMYYPTYPEAAQPWKFTNFGGIAGKSQGSTSLIEDCTAVVSIHATSYLGGIVGRLEDGSVVRNCSSRVAIDVNGYIGGIVGTAYTGVQIIGCRTAGRISGKYALGGLVGVIHGPDSLIEDSGSDVAVSWDSIRFPLQMFDNMGVKIGGLAGVAGELNITRAYARGSVFGYFYVGGLVGSAVNQGEMAMAQVYATGSVTSHTQEKTGGLVGAIGNSPPVFIGSVWDMDTTGLSWAVGQTYPPGTTPAGTQGGTTAQMQTQSFYEARGWVFHPDPNAAWIMQPGGYPELLNAATPPDPTIVIDGCDTGVPNMLLDGGYTMSDLIAECAADAANHGEFVSCVAQLANAWKTAGLITGREKGQIQSCAAQATIVSPP